MIKLDGVRWLVYDHSKEKAWWPISLYECWTAYYKNLKKNISYKVLSDSEEYPLGEF